MASCEPEKYMFMYKVKGRRDPLDFDIILFGKNKNGNYSQCYSNYIIEETDNSVKYKFEANLEITIKVMRELNDKYSSLKFKLLLEKSPNDVNFYWGLLKCKILFGRFNCFRKCVKPSLSLLDYSNKIYRNKGRELFKKIIRGKYMDKAIIYEFIKVIDAYYSYKCLDKNELKRKKDFFTEIFFTIKSPLKEAFKKEYNILINTGIDTK